MTRFYISGTIIHYIFNKNSLRRKTVQHRQFQKSLIQYFISNKSETESVCKGLKNATDTATDHVKNLAEDIGNLSNFPTELKKFFSVIIVISLNQDIIPN